MIVLGVETSGPVGSIALRRDGRCVEERFLPELGRRHAQSLVPEVVRFLGRHAVTPRDVNVVAVSLGPGSFTGLRVGVTFAKTFAYASGAHLAAVETFHAIAQMTPAAPSVVILADAQRGGLMFGRYIRKQDGQFVRENDIRLVAPADIPGLLRDGEAVSGSGLERLDASALRTIDISPPHLRTARAAIVAMLGEETIAAGRSADPWTLEPLYVRKSGAEERREGIEERGSRREDRSSATSFPSS